MTDPVSTAVLLIVGAAVIGPIEPESWHSPAQVRKEEICAAESAAEWSSGHGVPNTGGWQGASCMLPDDRYETLEQTCDRAMKQIGAHHPSQQIPGVSKDVVAFGTSGWKVAGRDVVCIPAPGGLRR